MNKKVLMMIFIIITTIMSLVYANSYGIEVPKDIRVGLYYGSGSKSIDVLKLSSPGGIEIGIMVEGEFEYISEVSANEEIVITRVDEKGAVYVENIGTIGSKTEYPYFVSLEKDEKNLIKINGDMYRGNVEIRSFSDSNFTVINHLSMQEYLYGVVPREIGGNSPIEAVKAQAIVARTYATKNYGKREKWGFDLYPTVDDQAYGGYEWENVNSNRAVDETDGQVVVYKGELIGGYYFSTSGGYTENSENVWGGKLDYLKAVPDYYEPEIDGNTTWEVEYSAADIKSKLANYNIDIGEIIDLVPIEHTDAGRVLELKVVGTKGEKILTKSNTRTYLGLKSQWYTINDDAPVVLEVDENDLPSKNEWDSNFDDDEINNNSEAANDDKDSDDEVIIMTPDYSSDENNFIVKEEPKEMKPLLKRIIASIIGKKNNIELNDEDEIEIINTEYEAMNNKSTFTFRGRGWGHAVGMSQNGAKGMAEEGFTCEEIITWYYSGVEVID